MDGLYVSEIMKTILFVPIAFFVVSCYPLPSPTHSISRYGLDATLVDAASGQPLRRKHVSLVIDGYQFEQRTSYNGNVSVSAAKSRYWTWLGGPAQASTPHAKISIGTNGYKSAMIEWSTSDDPPLLVKGDRIQAGNITMKKR